MFRVFLFIVLLMAATPAQAGFNDFMNKLFGRESGSKPEETLIAPFADVTVETPNGPEPQLSSQSIDVPHRSTHDIALWTVTAISDALSFKPETPQEQLKAKTAAFDVEGFKQYSAFIAGNGFLQSPDGAETTIQTFVPNEPLLLNEGVAGGRYRWLFEVPVMATYQPKGMAGYKNQNPQTRNFTIRVQVGRIVASPDQDGLAIETWDGRLVRDKK